MRDRSTQANNNNHSLPHCFDTCEIMGQASQDDTNNMDNLD